MWPGGTGPVADFDECPVGDRDIMSDEWEMACGTPRCGGPQRDEYGQNTGCPGCRHCDPPDHECKPYGFGIERSEDPALQRANEAVWAIVNQRPEGKCTSAWVSTWGMSKGRFNGGPRWADADFAYRDFLRRFWSRQSERRLRHSDIVWDRLCDECQTHGEAVEKYKAWATRSLTVKYRDESK
jgi:hypothetical protein